MKEWTDGVKANTGVCVIGEEGWIEIYIYYEF